VDQMDTVLAARSCSEGACSGAAITSLDQQALCLSHFLAESYARLEALDPRKAKSRNEPVDLAAMRSFLEECSRKALDVSLQSDNLSNLERGRLLDILLWAGELFIFLRAPLITWAGAPALRPGHGLEDSTARARSASRRL